MLAFYDNKPSNWEAVGNGSFMYRWNIEEVVPELTEENAEQEKVSSWKCEEVTVWPPTTADKVIEAVIREKYSASDEIGLVNKFNAYQQGVSSNASVVSEYEEYLAFVLSVKDMVKKDMEIEPDTPHGASSPRMADIARLLTLTVNTMSLTDDEALSTNELIEVMCEAMGKKAHIWKINRSLMEGVASIGTTLHLPLNEERLGKLTENYVASNTKIKKVIL